MSGGRCAASIVVKLGGSLAVDASLAHWLRELGRNRSARFVAVPGGGPFADAVRAAQTRWHFSDDVAHAMAITAMDQFGRMLCGIDLGSIPCSTVSQIEHAWSEGRLPVWLPARLMSRDRQLARTWDVTSDTIAAWLANLLRASGLLLIKSCTPPAERTDPALLAAANIVDPALPGFLSRNAIPLQTVHKDRWSELTELVTSMTSRA
jgi:5-(aminomethyl)-3-furanmethanol phosphate kinase